MISMRSRQPSASAEPRPPGPRMPVAWLSSTITIASCLSARAQMSGRGAFEAVHCGGDNVGMIGEAEIIVGAEVDDVAPRNLDAGALRALQLPLALVEAFRFQVVELGAQKITQTLVVRGCLEKGAVKEHR